MQEITKHAEFLLGQHQFQPPQRIGCPKKRSFITTSWVVFQRHIIGFT